MQLKCLALALLLIVAPGSAFAACDIGVSTGGTLKLSSNSVLLTSEAGAPAVVVISNITSLLSLVTITLSNPRLVTYPAGYPAGSATVEHNYSAGWLLGSSSNPAYTTGSRSFQVALGVVVTITINSRVTAPGGFQQGNYSTATTVTCS